MTQFILSENVIKCSQTCACTYYLWKISTNCLFFKSYINLSAPRKTIRALTYKMHRTTPQLINLYSLNYKHLCIHIVNVLYTHTRCLYWLIFSFSGRSTGSVISCAHADDQSERVIITNTIIYLVRHALMMAWSDFCKILLASQENS